MPEVANLAVVVSAETSQLERGLATANQQVEGFGKSMASVFSGIGVGLGIKAFDVITDGFKAAGDAAIGFNSNMEQSTIAFTSMLGSAEKAQAFLDDMKQFAATTPFEFPDLLQASKQMMAFGFAAQDVRPLLTAVGSAAAAMGTGRSGVDSITKALGQMKAATVVQAGELNQLTEQGVPAFQILADAMGISTGEVKKLASEGKIASDVFITAFQNWAQNNYGDMMAKQALTFEGAISTIKDSLTFAAAEAFKPFFELMSAGAVQLASFVQSDTFASWAQATAATVRTAFQVIADSVRTVQQVMAGDWSPAENIQPVTLAVGELAVAFRDTLWPAIQQVVAFMTGTVVPAFQAVGGFLAAHPGLVAALAAGWATFVILQTVAGWVMGLVAAFGAASAAITAAGGVIGAIVALLGGPLTVAILAVSAAVALLVVAWTENWGGIQEKTAAAWAVIEPIFTQLVDWLGVKIKAALDWLTTTGWPALVAAGETVGTFLTGALIPALTDLMEWLGPKIVAVCTWISETGWPALVTAGEAVWSFITTKIVPAITDLIEWIGPKLAAVVTWLYETGWPTLVTTGNTVWEMIGKVIQFFRDLYVELEKRGVFTELEGIWKTLTQTGDTVWKMVEIAYGWWVKLDEALLPIKTSIGELVAATLLPKLATDMDAVGASTSKTLDPIKLLGAGIQFAVEQVAKFLEPLKRFQESLDAISKIKMPSWMGGGGASGSSGNAAWDQIASEEGVDPALLASLIHEESGGDQSQRSSKGAIGLTQLLPGTAAGLGVDPYDPAQNVRGGARYLKQMLDMFGGDERRALIAYNAGPGGGQPGESTAYAQRVLAGRVKLPAGVATAQRAATPQLNQFGMTGGTLTAAEAAAFCGPAAAMWFAGIYGRMPDKAEAEAMARQVGWTPGYGMAGPASQVALNAAMGVSSNLISNPTPQQIADLAAQNVPFQLSTAGHYYQVQGGGLGGLNVGGSGIAAGGSEVMSLDQITALSGAINGVITLAPQMGAALASSSAEGGAALQGLQVSATTMTAGMTAETAAMATAVATNTNLMATGALTSVTAMGTGIMTTITDSAGSTITTVTDMSGQVTSQYATLANGVSLTMGDMAAGVLTSTTDLGTGVMTTVQDMSGNYVTTITDLAGNVTSQYVSLGAAATAETATMAAAVTEETASMGEAVLTSVTDMGDGIITITTDAAGNMTAVITDMAGEVTSTYSSMSDETVSLAEEMGQGVVSAMEDAGGDIQGVVEDWGSSIGDELGSIADDAQDQAADIGKGITDGIAEGIDDGSGDVMDAVRDVVKDAIDEAKDEAESDSPSKLFARELGLPIAQGVAVGIEKGSGLVADATRSLVGVPEYTAPMMGGSGSGSGSTETLVIQVEIGGRVAEEIYVTGRELATSRGRDRTPIGTFSP